MSRKLQTPDVLDIDDLLGPNKEENSKRLLQVSDIIPNFISNHVKTFALDQIISVNPDKFGNMLPITNSIENLSASNGWRIPNVKPQSIESFSAIMMADVSGYSKLTAILAEHGNSGTEILSKIMKGYLDKIADIVVEHKGDIIKFLGDAVIVNWKLQVDPSEYSTLENMKCIGVNCNCIKCLKGQVVLRACLCCLEMLKQLGKFSIDIEGIAMKELNIHLGVGAGSLFDVHVIADKDRYEHFVAGDAVKQLTTVLNIAKPEQLAVSHTAWQMLSNVVETKTIEIQSYDKRCVILNGLEKELTALKFNYYESQTYLENLKKREALFASIPSDVKSLIFQRYINRSAFHKLQIGFDNLMSLSELRQVTCLFIKIGDARLKDNEIEISETQTAISTVERAMKKYEGSLRQVMVDDKGCVLLSLFGLPPWAHENDAYYGLCAALDIAREFRMWEDYSMGVTTGVVSIGGIGNKIRTEYALMGDCINMAARFMCLPQAKKSIYCDERTYSLCDQDFRFESLSPVKLKGKQLPVPIFKPLGAFGRNNDPSKTGEAPPKVNIIGRKKEKEQLKTLFESFIKGQPKCIILEGDAGSGLSTFVSYVKDDAEVSGLICTSGSGAEVNKNSPNFAFRSIIHDLLEVIEGFADEEIIKNEDDEATAKSGPPSAVDASISRKNSSASVHDVEKSPVEEARGPIMDELKSPVLENKLRKKKKNKTSKNDLDLETGPVSFSQELNIGVDELESRIRSALSRIGQDPNNASLFSIIFPTEFHESDENALYHARTKMKELQEVVREMFKAIADVKKMILIIEEAQWCDSHSWNIIEEIFFGCPKVMIMIFTRSIKQYSGAGAEKVGFFRENKKTTHITLAGMSIDDAPDLILFYWDKNETKFLQTKPGELAKRKTVTSVNPDIVKNIHQRSNGNPLFVRSIVLSLFEADALKVDDWGQLNLNRSKIGPTFDLNKIIPDMDLQSIIVSQFDKLNSHFQQLLKVASVIGEEFFIEDAIYFLPKNLKYEFFDTQIAILDKYEFLRRESGDTVRYAFKSSMIRQSIYMMMHVEQRQQLHNDLAKHYESFLESVGLRLLVPIYEHYKLSNNIPMARRYLEEVCHLYFESRSMDEAIKHYLILLKETDNPSGWKEFGLKRCNWLKEVAEAYVWKQDYTSAVEYISNALKILGCSIPDSRWKLRLGFLKESLRQKWTWLYGTSYLKPVASAEKVRELFLSAADIFERLDERKTMEFSVLRALNASEYMKKDMVHAVCQSTYGLFQFKGKERRHQSWSYFEVSETIARNANTVSLDESAKIAWNMGFGLFLSGLMNLSQRKMKALMDYGHFFDDIRTWKKAAFLAGWMALLKGEYNDKICEEVVEIVSKTSEQTVALSELMTILLTASLYLSGSDIVEANLIKAKSLIDTVLEKPVTSDFTDKQIWFNLFVVQFEVELAILRFTPFVFDRILNLTERVNGITTKTKNIEDHHFISLFGLWRITILTSYIIDFIFIGTTTSEKQSNQKAQNFILASSNINAAVKKLCIVSQRILRKLRAAFISNQIFEIFEGLKFLLEASVISSELSGRSSKISKAISCFEKTKNNIKTEGPTAIRNQLSVLILKFKPKFALESFLSHGTIKQTPSRTNVLGTKVQ